MAYPKITQKQIENYLAEIALRDMRNSNQRAFKIYTTSRVWQQTFNTVMTKFIQEKYEQAKNKN